jgi:uncharacterized membrane protein (DUF485 family)
MATSASAAADRAKAVSPGIQTGRDVLDSPEFHDLISRRWRISLVLTAALFVVYYGFILLVATNKPLLSRPLGSATLGIVVGVAVILLSWGLTAVYVVWANRHYDPAVKQLRARLR